MQIPLPSPYIRALWVPFSIYFYNSTGHRSRSPSHLRRSASFRNGDGTGRSYEEHNTERNSQSRLPGSSRFQQHAPLQRQWNLPLSGRRNGAAPSTDFEPPARRPREYESSDASMSADIKRRRVGSVTASSSFSRRGHSPSPMDTRDDTFRSDPYTDEGNQQPRRGKNNGTHYSLFPVVLANLMELVALCHFHHRWEPSVRYCAVL